MTLDGFNWNMSGYVSKYSLPAELTQRDVERVFQLDPEPPKADDLNEYITAALQQRELKFFSFFLHYYEHRLNRRIHSFLHSDGGSRHDPERFLDMKLACMETLLEKLPDYDLKKNAAFTTYLYEFINDALLTCCMREEAWSPSSLDAYKKARAAAWLYHNTGSFAGTVAKFVEDKDCSPESAAKYLETAQAIRSRQPFYITSRDEGSEETGEDVTKDDSWDYEAYISGGIRAVAVRAAFDKLDYREQVLLEKRNAVCMRCGRVSPMDTRLSFEVLAVMFEGSGASGAERAYRRALEKLTELLLQSGPLHAVRVKRKSQKKRKKKIAAAVYQYQADCNGEWGEIQFDFENSAAEIVQLADWDTMNSHVFAEHTIRHILALPESRLPANAVIAFEDW